MSQPDPTGESPVTTAKPLARYGSRIKSAVCKLTFNYSARINQLLLNSTLSA